MTRCVVPGCSSIRSPNSGNLSFHRFPKEKAIRKKWLKFFGQSANINTNNMYICSLHFTPDSFTHIDGLGLEVKYRCKLNQTAVPTIRKPKMSMFSKKSQRKALIDIKKQLNKDKTATSAPTPAHVTMQSSATEEKENTTTKAYTAKPTDFLNQKLLIQALQSEVSESNQMLGLLQTATNRIVELEKVNKDLQEVHKEQVLRKAESILSEHFTQNQIDIILGRKKKVQQWASSELSMGFTISYFSKPALNFITKVCHFPLPSSKCLQDYAAKIDMRKGFFYDVFRILKAYGDTLTERDRICVMTYDEMSVSEAYEYDRRNDEVMKPSTKMQVIMIRALFGQWKQPIYADFDVKITLDLLDEAVRLAWEAGFECVAFNSDCGGSNQSVWSSINLAEERTFLVHPSTGRKIYLFADAPHTLKLLRNWLFDNGFWLENAIFLPPLDEQRTHPLWQIITKKNTEISDTSFLNEQHLTVNGSQRQNVAWAAKIFSRKCAVALQRKVSTPVAKNLAEFILMVNDYFDVLNSRNLKNSIILKQPYGTNLEAQNVALDNMYHLMATSVPGGKYNIQMFQRAIMMSITSLKALFNDMRQRFGINFIMTAKLNQDALEGLFAVIRARGGLNDHPTPLDALHRLRVIMLGKNLTSISAGQNTIDQCDEKFAILDVLRNLKNDSKAQDSQSLDAATQNAYIDDVLTDDTQEVLHFETEEDGFEYLIGAMVRKYKDEFPHLGAFTYTLQGPESEVDHDYAFPASYVQHLSLGGLTKPSDVWMEQAKALESAFKKFHGAAVSDRRNVCGNLAELLKKKYPDIPAKIVDHFIRHRTYIRINTLNRNIKEKKAQQTSVKRLIKPASRPLITKMKKLKKVLL